MILARRLNAPPAGALSAAFARLGLPPAAAEYLDAKLPHDAMLLTGITAVEGRFLKALAESDASPGVEQYPRYVPGDVRRRPGTALLSGRREQWDRLAAAAAAPELAGLKAALDRVLVGQPPDRLALGARVLPLGARTFIMGVVNVTPDSFSDGGQFLEPTQAVAQGVALAQAGADILDVGGESTRPGAAQVSAEEELRRVLPVLEGLRAKLDIALSIDTVKPEVARAACAAGAVLVNDVTGFRNPRMVEVIAEAKVAACAMHMQGTPTTMQAAPQYEDVVAQVMESLEESLRRAEGAGIPRARVLVDPGIGFGKTVEHNLALLRHLPDLRQLGSAVLVGTSRKSFLGTLTGRTGPAERAAATLGSIAAVAALGGADGVRVHDVASARDALAVADAIRRAL